MARISKDSVLLAFPVDAPLTPGTFDEVIALTQLGEVLAEFLVLGSEIEIRFAPPASLP
jgi:hypothetical protein